MKTENNVALKRFNSFGLSYTAQHLVKIYSENDIYDVIEDNMEPLYILGGGSNILLTKDISGYVLKNEIKGISVIEEDEYSALVEVGAGESWHQFVLWTLSHQLGGLENLSLIPGTVGAAPIQNIGAYGVEQKSTFHSLHCIHLKTGERKTYFKQACQFGYRDSIFKNELKGKVFITKVQYLLQKKNHKLSYEYGDIHAILSEKKIEHPGITDISDAVITIRQKKLPDPKNIGNAGSFFKNPVIDVSLFEKIKEHYPNLPFYHTDTEGKIKIPAGWLIEQAGFKGMERNGIGVHKNQALVLVHYEGGSGEALLQLAHEIQQKVFSIFGIQIEPEVNIW
jgi:UDP-N-acetylmuramate dehydrogenase